MNIAKASNKNRKAKRNTILVCAFVLLASFAIVLFRNVLVSPRFDNSETKLLAQIPDDIRAIIEDDESVPKGALAAVSNVISQPESETISETELTLTSAPIALTEPVLEINSVMELTPIQADNPEEIELIILDDEPVLFVIEDNPIPGEDILLVPDVVGMSREVAERTLLDSGFNVAVNEVYSDTEITDTVIAQHMPIGGLEFLQPRGSIIEIDVCLGTIPRIE